MKIYISGDFDKMDKSIYQNSKDLIHDLGLIPVTPVELEDQCAKKQLVNRVDILLGCNGILLLDNWETSENAMVERYIAEKKGLIILHQTLPGEKQSILCQTIQVINEVTGLAFHEYTGVSRKRDVVFARMLFAHQCRDRGMRPVEIAKFLNRDRTSVLYLLKTYENEVRYNASFREMAKSVIEKMNQV